MRMIGLTITRAPEYSKVYQIVRSTMVTVFSDQLGSGKFDPNRDWETSMKREPGSANGLGLELKNVREVVRRLRKNTEYGPRFQERLPDDEKFAPALFEGTPQRMESIIINRTMISRLPRESMTA